MPLTLLVPLLAAAGPLKLAATDTELSIDAGRLGRFGLSYPTLLAGQPERGLKPIEVRLAAGVASLRYDGGAELTVTTTPDGFTVTFVDRPADVTKLRLDGLIDFSFQAGGSWAAGDGDWQPFPAEKPPRPHLFQGNATSLRLRNAEGAQLGFTLPPWSYLQLQDNREWGWKTFAWMFIAPLGDARSYDVKVALTAATGPATVLVDRFGQNARTEFAGKLHSLEELRADVAADDAYYAGLRPPERDAFGGLPGSGAELGLQATGFFHVERKGDRWWLVDPAGNAFFHLGICCCQPSDDYTYIAGRESIYEWLPPPTGEFATAFRPGDTTAFSFYLANVIRKYGRPYDPQEWSARIIERVRRWGFNSAGAFGSPPKPVRDAAQFPYVAGLPLDPWDGKIPRLPALPETWDPFDEAIRAQVERNFAARVAPNAEDPLLIGYFLINEPAYEDIPKVVPTLPGKYACKRRLVQMLRDKYPTIAAFCEAWAVQADSFEALNDTGLAVTTQRAAADMAEYYGLFLEEYFRLVTETFRRNDSHHLLLGCRFQAGTINNEQLCRIAGRYLDVMSFNYYTYGLDVGLLRRIHTWTGGRPLMLSEFHWASPSDSGLPGGARDVGSQTERGLAYRNYVEQAAALGFVVGVEWFTLIDQAQTGRWFSKYNGENGNTGLLSVADRPWKPMLEGMMAANYGIYDVALGRRAPFVWDDPRFAAGGTGRKVVKVSRAVGPMTIDGGGAGWPGVPAEPISAARLVQGADAGGVEATFKLCWDEQYLYLLAQVTDPTPARNDLTGAGIWSADALELFCGPDPDTDGPLLFGDRQVLLSAGTVDGRPQWFFAHSPAQHQVQLAIVPAGDGSGYTLEAAIPWAALGFTPTVGQTIRFDLGLDDSADGRTRLRQLMWNGTALNSSDRSGWGRATLVN